MPSDPPEPASTDKLVEKIKREAGPLIPEQARRKVLNAVSSIVRAEYFRGPIPPPELFQGYENVLPGSADRILKMAEASLEHNISVTRQAQRDDNEDRRLGMKLGFAALCVLLVAAVICALTGHEIFGGGLVLTGVAGVITRFIAGRSTSDDSSSSPKQ